LRLPAVTLPADLPIVAERFDEVAETSAGLVSDWHNLNRPGCHRLPTHGIRIFADRLNAAL
jgi:hypothetical protein